MMAGLISPKPVYHAPQLGSFTNAGVSHALALQTDAKIYNLVVDLMDPATREAALLELSKKREQYDDLALVLWHSFGATLFAVNVC